MVTKEHYMNGTNQEHPVINQNYNSSKSNIYKVNMNKVAISNTHWTKPIKQLINTI